MGGRSRGGSSVAVGETVDLLQRCCTPLCLYEACHQKWRERARQRSGRTLADGQASGHSPGGGAELAGVIRRRLATGETVILLYPPLHLVGVSIAMEIKRQQNDSLAND